MGNGKRESEKWEENLSTSHQRIFDLLKNLTKHFVHTKNKIFSLYTRNAFYNLRASSFILVLCERTRERAAKPRGAEGRRA